jgi:hypothetical protein
VAILPDLDTTVIEKFRGVIDFYKLKNILPVARTWPKKPTPPYTALQAEAMATFSLAKKSTVRLTLHIIQAWRDLANGKQEAWADNYAALIMHYWKPYRAIPPIAVDYLVVETETDYQVKWYILQLFLDPAIPEETYTMQTPLVSKVDWLTVPRPIYFTLTNDAGFKLAAPMIPFNG